MDKPKIDFENIGFDAELWTIEPEYYRLDTRDFEWLKKQLIE